MTQVLRNPALRDLARQLDDVRNHARATAAGLAPAQLQWQPAPGAWSVGQCLEHLIVTHERYQPVIPGLLSAARQKTSGPDFGPWPSSLGGRLIIRGVTPGSRKVRTGKVFTPGPVPRPDVLQVLLRQFDEIESWMTQADGLELGRIRLSSPMIPLIRYNLGEAFTITVVHAERHLRQADRVKEQRDFPR